MKINALENKPLDATTIWNATMTSESSVRTVTVSILLERKWMETTTDIKHDIGKHQ